MKANPTRRFDVLLTAQEAYPALEAEFLKAEQDVIAGFRVFDPWTKLRSQNAKKIGDTWFDLIVDTLNRGIRISLIISDFDPVARQSMHAYAWECLDGLIAAGEASAHPELLCVRTSMHPARVGIAPRLALWPRTTKEIRKGLDEINKTPPDKREFYLRYLPFLRPMLKENGNQLVPRLRPPSLVPATHHQKIAVFDGKTLYAGGLDLNDRRYDTPQHNQPAADTWHDTQVILTGEIAQEAVEHLRTFEAITKGQPATPMRHLLRTISTRRKISWPYLSPKPVVQEIARAHATQIAQAQDLIYLETQFFRDKTLAGQLAKRAAEQPDLTLILILPAAPEDVAFEGASGPDAAYGEYLQVKAIKVIEEAFGPRLFIGSPAQPRAATPEGRATHYGGPLVYLHAKVSIFDQRSAIVSSANLNGRSLSWDTEVGVPTEGPEEAKTLTTRCFKHWLGPDAGPRFYDVKTACAAWAERASANAHVPPAQRKGFLLPYAKEPAEQLGYNLPGVPEEMA